MESKHTAVDWLIEQLKPSISFQQKHIDDLKEKAKEIEQRQFNKTTEAFIKNREQTRALVFENGFLSGFECALKFSENFYNELEKTQLAEDDFIKEYLQEKSNEIYMKNNKNYIYE